MLTQCVIDINHGVASKPHDEDRAGKDKSVLFRSTTQPRKALRPWVTVPPCSEISSCELSTRGEVGGMEEAAFAAGGLSASSPLRT